MKNLLLVLIVALGLTPLAHADLNDDMQNDEIERGWGGGPPSPAPYPGPGRGPGGPGWDPGHGPPPPGSGPGHGPGYPGGPGHGGPGHGGPGYPGPRPGPGPGYPPGPRPGPGPGYPPPPVYHSEYIRCESYANYGMQQCWINPNRVQDVRLYQQSSYEPCIYGRTYGWNYDRIWVDRGCRATFEVIRY